jgi:hypothetical protein
MMPSQSRSGSGTLQHSIFKTDRGPNAILAIPPTQVRFPRRRSASHLCDLSSEFRAVAAKPGGKGTRP